MANCRNAISYLSHAFSRVRVHAGKILRVIGGKDQPLRPDALQSAIECHHAAFESRHVEILAEGLFQGTETIALAGQSLFDCGKS
jgi:hypothetical protein